MWILDYLGIIQTGIGSILWRFESLIFSYFSLFGDFGFCFYTKYGDGGVDISPIADCNKTEVWELGKELGILKEIIDAPPTDGLWDDGRTDEGQLGLSYKELEEAMDNENSVNRDKYNSIRSVNLHKMEPIPVCKIPN